MINLSDENLNITSSGHGLRETLFYNLFGELQVYETRNDMLEAMPYLKGGAISLDGGVMKGKGRLLLGFSDPKIRFPVVSLTPKTLDESKAPQDVITKTRAMDVKIKLLEAIERNITEKEKDHEELLTKLDKKKPKFDEISVRVIQPFGIQLDQCTPMQTPKKFHTKQEVP